VVPPQSVKLKSAKWQSSQKIGEFKSALQFGEAKTAKLPSKCHLVV
jgi:hypothetical protein